MNFSERFFAQHKTFVLKIAIFFIYLLIIYPACPARGKKSDDSTCTSHRFFFLSAEDASRAERSRVSEILLLLQKASPPDTFSFACQKRTRKAPATFEAREAAGCGSLRLLRALRGTRILQAAAPTAPPCFGRWPRSSPLQTRGCSPLVTPKLLGSIQKNPSRFAKGFFVFRRFEVAYATSRAGKPSLYPLRDSRRLTAARCRQPLRPLP